MKAFIRRRDLLNIWTPRHASLCFVAGNQELEEMVSLPGRERQKRQWRQGWNCRCFNSYSPAGLSIMVWNEWRRDNRFARKGSQVQAAQRSQFTNALVRFSRRVSTPEIKVLHMWHLAKGDVLNPRRRKRHQNWRGRTLTATSSRMQRR